MAFRSLFLSRDENMQVIFVVALLFSFALIGIDTIVSLFLCECMKTIMNEKKTYVSK